jgi:AbrB family looped-hinge helix DNA binding protein
MKPLIEHAAISERGQIVIPKNIRESLNLTNEDTVVFYAPGDGSATIKRVNREALAEEFRKMRAKVKKEDQLSEEDIVKLIHEMRAERRRPGHKRTDFGADLAEWERRTGIKFKPRK